MKKSKYVITQYYEEPSVVKQIKKKIPDQEKSKWMRNLTKKGLEEIKK
jgi:hypothetical protein